VKPKIIPPQTAREIAKFLVSNAADHVLCVGPLVWQPSDGLKSKVWYFVVGSADAVFAQTAPDKATAQPSLDLQEKCG
jgi:hypothetical protein